MKLDPYIMFYGRCEEALEFYKNALGGEYHLSRVGESPVKDHFPPERYDKVMHATFTGNGFSFMASDGREDKSVDPEEGNISLSLGFSDAKQGERVFAALSEGGNVTMPLGEVPWGGRFGMLADKFGVEWMITI